MEVESCKKNEIIIQNLQEKLDMYKNSSERSKDDQNKQQEFLMKQ